MVEKNFENELVTLRNKLGKVNEVLHSKYDALRDQYGRIAIFCSNVCNDLEKNADMAEAFRTVPSSSQNYEYIHALKTAIYSYLLAKRCGLETDQANDLFLAGFVHDIGNAFVPKAILNKTGSLTPEEWAVVRTHPAKGAETLENLGAPNEVVTSALQHHERMDGKGYPHSRKGEEISMGARIVSIADVFVALTSERPGEMPKSNPQAISKMKFMPGKFDEELLRAFIEILSG
jgi:HD-GYP domain-containing protein (c-di-GMP phosphodiesterase class II)